MITLSTSFKDNLAQMPSIDGLARLDLMGPDNAVVDSIENQPGKQGSLAVYLYLAEEFGAINAKAAAHGLLVFAEHTKDAQQRPGAHPNIDRLVEIAGGAAPLNVAQIMS